MTRGEIRSFLEDGIILLTDVTYGSGRVSEFNSNRSRVYPMCWIESLSVSTELTDNELPINAWNVNLHVAKKDLADSVEAQYEALIDDCDEMAQQLIKYYNSQVSGFKLVTITGITRNPFIKKNADCLSGVILSFTLNSPDTTNLC
jgi:hypothetical protein